jgi:hypothetical protein
MKIFPEKDCSIELNNDDFLAISELKIQTLSKRQFVSNWNNQVFIGDINENEFELSLSKKMFVELCVVNGKLHNRKAIMKMQTGKIAKIIFAAIVLFSLSGMLVAIMQSKLNLVIYLVLNILVMRFVFLEIGFRYASKNFILKLNEIIGLKNNL